MLRRPSDYQEATHKFIFAPSPPPLSFRFGILKFSAR
jgi:hypothetical protein